MHLPDEFINSGAAASLAGAAAAIVGFAVHKVRQAFMEKIPVLKMRLASFPDFGGESGMSLESRLSRYGREQVWRMAVAGALIFSAQMVNFPVADGTSGHLLGGVLAALVVGPFAALIVMAVILSAQALMFGDGGIVALGANIFNMGVVGALGGYAFFRFLLRGAKDAKRICLRSAFVAAWVSVIGAAVAASLEMAISGTESLSAVLPAMTMTHIIIGVAEGMITVAVLSVLMQRNFKLAMLPDESSDEK